MTPGDEPQILPGGKPYPRYCPRCGQKTVWQTTTPYSTVMRHDGELHQIELPDLEVPFCEACSEMIFDTQACEQVSRAFRQRLGLLAPAEIRAHRERLGLSQQELAAHLNVAPTIVAQWESGLAIPSRAIDRFLRVYFQSPEARSAIIELAAPRNGA
jgi:putative zinc finger/helix-turn-helix YgiT family protein